MKFIDADKLRAELERRITDNTFGAKLELIDILAWLDTLESERPEPYNPVYDGAYLNEKIAKASKTWKGVDVDKYMDEVRGRGPDKSLEEEVKNYFQGYWPGTETAEQCNTDLHFTPPAIIRLARHFYELGKQAMKEQMLKDAVEGIVGMHLTDKGTKVTVNSGYLPEEMGIRSDSKVRIIIVKED